jgi:hypothetical protein
MRVRLDELIATSENSQLISYAFENRSVRFQLYHEGLAALLTVEARTDTVYGRSIPLDERRARCRIAIADLADLLFIQDGHYIPSTETEVALSESDRHLNLAYGRKTEDARWILWLKGRYDLLCFLLRDLADLQWTLD